VPFIGPRRERSGQRGEQPAAWWASMAQPFRFQRETERRGNREVVSRWLFEGVEGAWEVSRRRSRAAARPVMQGGSVAWPEEGDEGGVGQLDQFGQGCRTLGGLARPFGPDGNWAGARKKKNKKGACDGLGQIDSRAGIKEERIWVAEMAFKFCSWFFI
jgi:hypothetical protein